MGRHPIDGMRQVLQVAKGCVTVADDAAGLVLQELRCGGF